MELLKDFPVVIELPVQWGDQDALGHVNNVVYFRWWESSRIAFAERVGIVRYRPDTTLGTVLVSIKCDFRKQLVFPDTVRIGARLTHLGNSSFAVEHRLVSVKLNAIAAEAVSTMVTFDFVQQSAVRAPDEIRAKMMEMMAR